MTIAIINQGHGKTAAYAALELKRFLSQYTDETITESMRADRYFILNQDTSTAEYGYTITGGTYHGKPAVFLSGDTEASLLSSVYGALDKMGVFFDIDGPILSRPFTLDELDHSHFAITPFCRNRGVRQHINFPMDISSYPLEEAKEYIRNLARMQMNAITFHSYTGQWHGYETKDKKVLAGNFFYGQRYIVPSYDPITEIVRNNQTYCIPEVEAMIEDVSGREIYAIHWLNQLMTTAKEAGMRVVLSIEFPPGESRETLINICRSVLTEYPHIDALEWITPEGGGEGQPCALDAIPLSQFIDSQPAAFAGTMANLLKAVDLYQSKSAIFDGLSEKPIQIGLYVMCKETLKAAKGIMESLLPKEVVWTFLPAHGSKAAADNIEYMCFSKENWQNTLLYSWIEFDGNMYLQQNSSDGIEDLLSLAQKDCNSIYGLCLNHWRTAENRGTIAYAAHAMLAPLSTNAFYTQYAEVYGIRNQDLFEKSMVCLARLDTFNRDKLFNIGFCYLGCWLGLKGLGWIRGWQKPDMHKSIHAYERIICDLNTCLETISREVGRKWIRFLSNRIECSILQIQTILELSKIAEFVVDDEPWLLSHAQRLKVAEHCENAMNLSKAYIDKHVELIYDRGCEGTIISYYATMPVYIDHIKQYFVYGESECIHEAPGYDQPPPPNPNYLHA